MVVFPKKVGFFSQTSASQSPNGTSRDLVFQEPLVSLPKAHPVFGGCRAWGWFPSASILIAWRGAARAQIGREVGADPCGLPAKRRFHLWGRSPTSSLPRASSKHFWTCSVTCLRCFKTHRGLLFAVHCCLPSRVWLCDPMDCSTPGFPVHHHLPEFAQPHVHWVSDAIQPSHPLSSPSPPAFSLSQYQGLFQWVGSSHQVAKELELQHQSL